MKSLEAYRVPRSVAAIVATGTVALSAYGIGDNPTAQALSDIKCDSIEIDAQGANSIDGHTLVNTIQSFAVSQYVEGVPQPDPIDLNVLQNAVTTEIRQDIVVGDIPLPARDQDTYSVCISPGNPNYISVDLVQQI